MLEISRPETAVPLEGRPPCRPILAERSSAPIRPTRPRWRAGKMGADGAAVYDRRFHRSTQSANKFL